MRAMRERIQTLEIIHQDPELSIVFADDTNRTIYTDGRESPDGLGAGYLEGKAKWKGGSKLVFQSETANGSEITEIYELNDSGELLFVTVKMKGDGRRPDLSFRRVYDAADVSVPVQQDSDSDIG